MKPSPQDDAREFISIFDPERKQSTETAFNLITEEYKEAVSAFWDLRKHQVNISPSKTKGSRSEFLKELADLVYVCFQMAERLNMDLDEAVRLVHLSNLSKLDENGKPIYREDGKVLKGPNYLPPDLSSCI